MVAIGTLNTKISKLHRGATTNTRLSTYLMMKIHLQEVLAAIAPPMMGPARSAKALVMLM